MNPKCSQKELDVMRYLDQCLTASTKGLDKADSRFYKNFTKALENSSDEEKELFKSLSEKDFFTTLSFFNPADQYLKSPSSDEVSLSGLINEVVCYNVSNSKIEEHGIKFRIWAEQFRELLDKNVLGEEFDAAIEQSIFNQAKKDYDMLTSNKKWSLEDSFGYAAKVLKDEARYGVSELSYGAGPHSRKVHEEIRKDHGFSYHIKEKILDFLSRRVAKGSAKMKLKRLKKLQTEYGLDERVVYADDVLYSDALAHAISNDFFSDKQLKKIPLEEGETLENYVSVCKQDEIVAKYKNKLRTKRNFYFDFNYSTFED